MKTKIFTLLLVLMASMGTMFAWNYERVHIGDLYYNLDATNQTAEVTYKSYTNYNYNYKYNEYWGITTANIPASVTYSDVVYSVTSIGGSAFRDCSGLTSVTIPNSVTSIGDNAFYYCSGLTSVTIGNSVTSIGYEAFRGCTGLTSPVYNAHVFAFMPTSYSGAYTIPDGIESIAGGAFSSCTSLTSVTIPNSVTSIGSSAFSGCTGLTSVTIPNSVTSIGSSAFSGCTGLTSVTIGNSVTSIGNYAFGSCSSLTSVTIPNSVTSIGSSAFYGCTGLTSLKLSAMIEPAEGENMLIAGLYNSSRQRMGNYGYEWLKNLISIEAPAWFFDVQETDWIYCSNQLETVVVCSGELKDNGFAVIHRSYKTLKKLDLSAVSNTELADEAMKNFYNLTELKLPSNMEYIGYMSVAECVKLQSINIPAGVQAIEDRAFENCRSLQTITFGGASAAPAIHGMPATGSSQLSRIGNWVFYNCHELQNLEIPEGVTEIGDGAFYGCTYLENLALPASIQSIGDNCFALCSKMKRIDVAAMAPPTIHAKTFYDVNRSIPVYVPEGSESSYNTDTYWKEFNIRTRPDALETILSNPSDSLKKILYNGQLYILRDGKTYNMTGKTL